MSEIVLRIRDLQVVFETSKVNIHAINGINLDVAVREVVGIVGESGLQNEPWH